MILSRFKGQQICIGDDVVITVVEIDRGKVRIGVTAPKNVSVDRKEIRERNTPRPPTSPSVSTPTPVPGVQLPPASSPAAAPGAHQPKEGEK